MKLLLSLFIIASVHVMEPTLPHIFTVESSEQSFNFAVKNGKIVPYDNCLFPGPFGSFAADPYNWHAIRTYFEKEGYKVPPLRSEMKLSRKRPVSRKRQRKMDRMERRRRGILAIYKSTCHVAD